MSLNSEEQRRTSAELRQNLEFSGLSAADAASDLDFTAARLESTLALDYASDPVDVWQLRDYLEQAVRDAGHTPIAFTVLTESSRLSARGWFRLREAPRHVGSA
jgi:hypothetical protein